jgi:hypothetical protein
MLLWKRPIVNKLATRISYSNSANLIWPDCSLTLYMPLPSLIRATFPVHLILLDFITRTTAGEEYRLWSCSLWCFLQSILIYYLHITAFVVNLIARSWGYSASSLSIGYIYILYTALQTGRSRDRFPMVSIFHWHNPSGRTMARGRLSLL